MANVVMCALCELNIQPSTVRVSCMNCNSILHRECGASSHPGDGVATRTASTSMEVHHCPLCRPVDLNDAISENDEQEEHLVGANNTITVLYSDSDDDVCTVTFVVNSSEDVNISVAAEKEFIPTRASGSQTPHRHDDEGLRIVNTRPCSIENNNDITYTLVRGSTIRNRDKLYDSIGYSYTYFRTTMSSITWRCTCRSKPIDCQARLRVCDGKYIRTTTEHNHPPNVMQQVVDIIRSEVKSRALENPSESCMDIARNIVQEYLPTDVKPSGVGLRMGRIENNMKCARRVEAQKNALDAILF